MRFAVLFTIVLTFSFSLHANDFEKLKEAVDTGVESVREILADKTIDVTARDMKNQGQTILHYAAKTAEDPQIIEVLLEDGRIKKNARTTWSGQTALHFAVERVEKVRDSATEYEERAGDIVILGRFLLDQDVDVNSRDRWGRTPLFYVRSGDVAALFVNNNVPLSEAEHALIMRFIISSSRPALHYALLQNTEFALQGRIADRVDMNARDVKGRTPLFEVAGFGTPEAVAQLVDAGAFVMTTDRNGLIPFHMAASTGRLKVLDRLIDLVPEDKVIEMLNAQDVRGETPLFKAVDLHFPFVVEFLLKKGADPNISDIAKNTPLHRAAFLRANLIQTALLEAGADPNAQNYRGETPLHELVTSPEKEMPGKGMIREMLEKGADSSIPNHRGYTPLMDFILFMGKDIAQSRGTSIFMRKVTEQNRVTLISLLKGHKASLEASNDRNEQNVIQVASRKGYFQARELLSESRSALDGCF